MVNYTVNQVAGLAGVSVRTLHVYDKMGLLKPGKRTSAGYRTYGEKELLRLQQILVYKELGMPLRNIAAILDEPDFNLVQALDTHKQSLKHKQQQLLAMIKSIDRTIDHLKNNTMKNYEELYEGFSKDEATAMRKEAMQKWPEETARAEDHLLKLGRQNFKALQQEQQHITNALIRLKDHAPESPEVQFEIARHYQNICAFWGANAGDRKQAEKYAGLADLYLADKRYTRVNGEPDEPFGLFMSKAMKHYATGL